MMQGRVVQWWWGLVVLGLGTLLSACAAHPVVPSGGAKEDAVESASEAASEHYWWQVAFRRPYEGKGEPRWATDLLLADRLLAPLVRAHSSRIPLWRFHRRAGVDAAGHQFSLIFYADKATADAIFTAVHANTSLRALMDRGELTEVLTFCHLGRSCRSEISATGDPHWHPAIGTAWPHYIMGASATWLTLIQTLALERGPPVSEDIDTVLAYYEGLRQTMNAIWRGQGQHAFFHHLSAVFGYEPLLIESEIRF